MGNIIYFEEMQKKNPSQGISRAKGHEKNKTSSAKLAIGDRIRCIVSEIRRIWTIFLLRLLLIVCKS